MLRADVFRAIWREGGRWAVAVLVGGVVRPVGAYKRLDRAKAAATAAVARHDRRVARGVRGPFAAEPLTGWAVTYGSF
jgi:hypothetical protein